MTRDILAATLGLGLVFGCSQQEPAIQRGVQPVSEAQPAPASPQQQPRTAVIWVRGFSCPLCVQAVKKELQAVNGVEGVDVNYQEEFATIRLASRKPPTREQLVQAIERSGYVLTKLEMQ